MHWRDLRHVVEKAPDTSNRDVGDGTHSLNAAFVLIHFSLRYKSACVKQFFKEAGVNNVVVFLADDCMCDAPVTKDNKTDNSHDDDDDDDNTH
jgi:hypothetical protein